MPRSEVLQDTREDAVRDYAVKAVREIGLQVIENMQRRCVKREPYSAPPNSAPVMAVSGGAPSCCPISSDFRKLKDFLWDVIAIVRRINVIEEGCEAPKSVRTVEVGVHEGNVLAKFLGIRWLGGTGAATVYPLQTKELLRFLRRSRHASEVVPKAPKATVQKERC
jgi:hypothetical protein